MKTSWKEDNNKDKSDVVGKIFKRAGLGKRQKNVWYEKRDSGNKLENRRENKFTWYYRESMREIILLMEEKGIIFLKCL